jgi:hypothetical protein
MRLLSYQSTPGMGAHKAPRSDAAISGCDAVRSCSSRKKTTARCRFGSNVMIQSSLLVAWSRSEHLVAHDSQTVVDS